MATLAEQINKILLSGKRVKTKEEQDRIIQMLSGLSVDYSNAEYPKMGASEFVSGNAPKAALSPQEILKSYYGENLPREIIAAGNYNIQRPTIKPESYSRIFDTIPASKTTKYGSSYSINNNNEPLVKLTSGDALRIKQLNDKTLREWLKDNDPKYREIAEKHFKMNSLNPSITESNNLDALRHEIGHHITLADKSKELPRQANNSGYLASDGFEKFGEHTGDMNETTQALSALQREMFKNTGKRLHPVDFMGLVNKGEIPDFLTQEGQRILIYAKNLKNVADKSKDKKKKEEAKKALEAISRMAPAVVQNQKKYGLNLPIG